MKVLISGIGRSGTTMLYHQIGNALRHVYPTVHYRYEPYLWDVRAPDASRVTFNQEKISHFGISAHLATPLVLDTTHDTHLKFVNDIFPEPKPPRGTAYLAKIIRGAGRLTSFIEAHPDIKIIASLRNPIDTINSSLGLFSFTGEEFHKSDVKRLFQSVKKYYGITIEKKPEDIPVLESSIWWWRLLTDATLDCAKKFPDNIHIISHDLFYSQKEKEIKKISKFLNVKSTLPLYANISKPAGPQTTKRHLTYTDIEKIEPHLEVYCKRLSEMTDSNFDWSFRDKIYKKYSSRKFEPPVLSKNFVELSYVALRRRIANENLEPWRLAPADSGERINLTRTVSQIAKQFYNSQADLTIRYPFINRASSKLKVGCCITCYNNEATIIDTVTSALEQTRPFEQIVIVDDCSNDNSPFRLDDLAWKYPWVKVLRNTLNLGVSASRNKGYAALDCEFITQLDGDDCFWPTKNRDESEILKNDPRSVAFSPIVLCGRFGTTHPVSGMKNYNAQSSDNVWKLLAKHEGVPRDMTFAKSYWEKLGGYDNTMSLYEDLDFKVRLAHLIEAPWRLSSARAGTLYNKRRESSASTEKKYAHFRARLRLLFKNLEALERSMGRRNEIIRSLDVFQQAPRYSDAIEKVENILVQKDFKERLKALNSRSIVNATYDKYLDTISFLATANGKSPVWWEVGKNFTNKLASHKNFASYVGAWKTAPSSTVDVVISQRTEAISFEMYNIHWPMMPIEIEMSDGNTSVTRTFKLKKSARKDDKWHLETLRWEMPIAAGAYKLTFRSSEFIPKSQENKDDLFVLLSGILIDT